MFESTGKFRCPRLCNRQGELTPPANRQPKAKCLGFRPYDPATKTFGPYQWIDYGTVQSRRTNFGAGIVEINKRAGLTESKYAVGLWCQNRPEWQVTGTNTLRFEPNLR
jgi:hypothetical protein